MTPAPQLIDLVGGTPMVRIETPYPTPHPGYLAKLEGLGAGGLKARSAEYMVMRARERGELPPGARIVESTSGTLGLGLAYVGLALGHPVTLVVDDELDDGTRNLLSAMGVDLHVASEPAVEGGWQAARLDVVRRILDSDDGAWWPDQYANPDNAAGYHRLAGEIVHDTATHLGDGARVDVLVCSVGTGGHSQGIIRGLRGHWPDLRVIGVDAVGSAIFGPEPRPRLMRGLGSSIHPANVHHELFDEVHWVGPVEAVHACRALARHGFHTGGWSTGAVATVAGWTAAREPGAVVVTVFPDGPHRYLHTIFDDDWCRERGLLVSPVLAPHRTGDCRCDSSCWTRCCEIRDPDTGLVVRAGGAP